MPSFSSTVTFDDGRTTVKTAGMRTVFKGRCDSAAEQIAILQDLYLQAVDRIDGLQNLIDEKTTIVVDRK